MIGNDIVSIASATQSGKRPLSSYLARICVADESSGLSPFYAPDQLLWVLWSAKESAYKLYVQAGGTPIFAPKKFRFEASAFGGENLRGFVTTPIGKCQTRIRIGRDAIFAESWPLNQAHQSIFSQTFNLRSSRYRRQSTELRTLVKKLIAARAGLRASDISVEKDQRGIPFLALRDRAHPGPISLTHHGHFGAFSMMIHKNSPSFSWNENGL